MRLGLLRISDSLSLALQHWPSRAAWEKTRSFDLYHTWFAEYEPILGLWDQLMEFEKGWEVEVLLRQSSLAEKQAQ